MLPNGLRRKALRWGGDGVEKSSKSKKLQKRMKLPVEAAESPPSAARFARRRYLFVIFSLSGNQISRKHFQKVYFHQ